MVQINREGNRSSITHSEIWGVNESTKIYIHYSDGTLTIREAEEWTDNRSFISQEDASVNKQYEFEPRQFTELKRRYSDWNDVLSRTGYTLDKPKF